MTTVAYLGPENTDTHLAALQKFGKRNRYLHEPTVDDVFRLVERRTAAFGVVPIENSLEGPVTHTLDRFLDGKNSPVRIAGEFEFSIRHYLITQPAVRLPEVEVVYSHPQALAQCRSWIAAHLPRRVELAETNSTSEAVNVVVHKGRPRHAFSVKHLAAIGRKEAAEHYDLKATAIADSRLNKTRFLILSLREPAKARRSKTSILFASKDRPGALYDALGSFTRERINLTKIESRPRQNEPWRYMFYVDFEGHCQDLPSEAALMGLLRHTSFIKLLGSYPAATTPMPENGTRSDGSEEVQPGAMGELLSEGEESKKGESR